VLGIDEDFGLELLEALESNMTTPADYQTFLNAERCRRALRKTQKAIEQWVTTNEECPGNPTFGRAYGMDNKAVYQKVIFYFSLQSKIKSLWRCTYGGSWTLAEVYDFVDIKLTGTAKYRRRCGAEVNKSENLEKTYFGGGNGILNWRPYSGGRSLSHYDFNVDFGIRYATDRNPNPPPYVPSMHYRIVDGY